MGSSRTKAPANQKASKKKTARSGRSGGAVPLTPVTPKIGETSGNLQAREEAFKRRRAKTG